MSEVQRKNTHFYARDTRNKSLKGFARCAAKRGTKNKNTVAFSQKVSTYASI